MALPQFTIREMLEAGVHFGHRTRRWNPLMQQYIYGSRNGIHIIDLQQTVPMMYQAMAVVRQVAASGGRVLFVGSKRQAQDIVAETATRCGQYYVNHRWLGGMLTNWKTINNSIKRLKTLEEILKNPEGSNKTKKELLEMSREHEKLQRALGGIKDMGGLPDVVFVIDSNKENIAIAEANKLGIPVIAVLDTNSTPNGVDYPIPGNDDSTRALRLYCRLISDAILDGISEHVAKAGVSADKGEAGESRSGGRRTVVNLSSKAAAAAAADEKEADAEVVAKADAELAKAAAAQN
jgi:small subunit ribosomal protein S2